MHAHVAAHCRGAPPTGEVRIFMERADKQVSKVHHKLVMQTLVRALGAGNRSTWLGGMGRGGGGGVSLLIFRGEGVAGTT